MKILTFDIEDWWGYDYCKLGDRSDWEPRLDKYLRTVLDLLEEKGTKATFFILGEVAVSNPAVVRSIAERGHHIGCHSFSHTFWKQPTEKEIKEDTYKALNAIEDCIGQKVTAYRASRHGASGSGCRSWRGGWLWAYVICLYRQGYRQVSNRDSQLRRISCNSGS